MAPEHLRGQPGRASDVWGVGVLLYELLTGERPFIGADRRAVARAILRSPPPPPTDFNPALPHWIEAVLSRALAKEPGDRYASAAAMGEALVEGLPEVRDALGLALAWQAAQQGPDAEEVAEAAAFIPAGAFFMGSHDGPPDERPVHRVYLDAFTLARCTVTNAQWRTFVEANPEWQRKHIPSEYHNGHYLDHWVGDTYPEGTADLPVIYVSWLAAEAYCAWVGGRLPTEAEWEKAAQGGPTATRYPWGDDTSPAQAHYDAGSTRMDAAEALRSLKPVASYAPNGYGLYQMSGNVWEWCADWYAPNAYAQRPAENPTGPKAGTCRVVRGGAWCFNAGAARCASRFYLPPQTCHGAVGVRVAWDTKKEGTVG
jgi:formylglycine-generating enzyme required for sulfatase activity